MSFQKTCPVCRRNNLQTITEHQSMLYPEFEDERAFHRFVVKQCRDCQHLFVDTGESDEWLSSLYTKPLEQEIWSLNGEEPYEEVLHFCSIELHKAILEHAGRIVDFGCGRGTLLEIANTLAPSDRLLGVDFKNNLQHSIPFYECDLSRLNESTNGPESGFAFAFCMHVLEHMPDPVTFLAQIRKRSSPQGFLYLEVPDHENMPQDTLLSSNLWSVQHVNYFTTASLNRCLQLAGWKIIKQDTSLFGVVPRTRVIATPAPDTNGAQQTQEAFVRLERLRKEAAGKIIGLAPKGPLHIWGIGSDFRQMILISKHLKEMIKQENVTLYDKALAGQSFHGKTVRDSSTLSSVSGKIVITARPANTRQAMKKLTETWENSASIVDVWEQ